VRCIEPRAPPPGLRLRAIAEARQLDEEVGRYFERLLREYGLRGSYWYEYVNRQKRDKIRGKIMG